MKVIQINNVYGIGSTGKITKDLHTYLVNKGHESIVLYGRKKVQGDNQIKKVCPEWYAKLNNLRSRFDGVMYGGCYFSTKFIINIIKKEKPDIVHLQCINGYFCNIFKLLSFLKKYNIKTVLTLHAEFMYTSNCGYAGDCNQWIEGCKKCPRLNEETLSIFLDRTNYSWNKMHAIFEGWNDLTIVGCSNWIKNRALMSKGLRNTSALVIHNGIDNDKLFFPRLEQKQLIREKYGIKSTNKIILFVAPAFSKLKGFDYVVNLIKLCSDLPFTFLLVGDETDLAWDNAIVFGKIKNQTELAKIYSCADAMIICSRNENYPTVCLEAISCGTPVVGFDIGGIKETISSGMGITVPIGDLFAMKSALIEVTRKAPNNDDIKNARYKHSFRRMSEDYLELYKQVTN